MNPEAISGGIASAVVGVIMIVASLQILPSIDYNHKRKLVNERYRVVKSNSDYSLEKKSGEVFEIFIEGYTTLALAKHAKDSLVAHEIGKIEKVNFF